MRTDARHGTVNISKDTSVVGSVMGKPIVHGLGDPASPLDIRSLLVEEIMPSSAFVPGINLIVATSFAKLLAELHVAKVLSCRRIVGVLRTVALRCGLAGTALRHQSCAAGPSRPSARRQHTRTSVIAPACASP